MPSYRWTVRFDADDEDEAKDAVYGEDGALAQFSNVLDEELEPLEGDE